MYAVIELAGHQYRVEEGDVIKTQRLPNTPVDESFDASHVLFVDGGDGNVHFGSPHVKDVSVKLRVLDEGRGKKIRVLKYQAKSNWKRQWGHRQWYSTIKVDSISTS